MPDHKNIVHGRASPMDQYSHVQMYKIKIDGSLLICYFCEIYIRTLNMWGRFKLGLI